MIRFENISWAAETFALSGVSFTVPQGSYAVLMGRSGSGKTSLLELLCGLRFPSSGAIWIGDREITNLTPGERGIGYVPQDGALFPTMTVRENIGFAPRIRGESGPGSRAAVESLAERLGIAGVLDRKPQHLSGGERQRVALARALAATPTVLVLDEPLSALDEELREDLARLLKEIQRDLKLTTLHVTHHRQEAAQLADHVLRLENGSVACDPVLQSNG
jgi:ABC-type branched-subunit amino acid transport system ATPase component